MNIQQLRAQIAALQDATMDENRNFRSDYDEGKFDALSTVDALLDSLQEEPVSEDFEEVVKTLWNEINSGHEYSVIESYNVFYGLCLDIANWQRTQMMSKAIDAHCFGFQGAALFSFRLPADKYLVGSEVKVIVIKED